jgi:uncharacterized protein
MVTHLRKIKDFKVKNPIMIEGLPGIGNVGKIAVDFMIDNLKAKKIYEIHSYHFPNAVFINEKNLVELPMVELYHANVNNDDLLLLAGDIQPIDEASCYEFCDKILEMFKKLNGREIITLGGIGLQKVPLSPKVYCTANTKSIINEYESANLRQDIYGVVGPIIGVTGLLVGLSGQAGIPAIALLAETLGHPSYLGIKGAREILKILNKKLQLKLNLKELDEEIVEIEKEISSKTKQLEFMQQKRKSKTAGSSTEMDYIG